MMFFDRRAAVFPAGLVDFWASGAACANHRARAREIAGEMDGQVTVAKLNIDDNPKVPQQYGVRAFTLMLFKDGEVTATKIGALPKGQLKDRQWVL